MHELLLSLFYLLRELLLPESLLSLLSPNSLLLLLKAFDSRFIGGCCSLVELLTILEGFLGLIFNRISIDLSSGASRNCFIITTLVYIED